MPAKVKVAVSFETKAQQRFLTHRGKFVPLNAKGEGSFNVEPNASTAITFGIEGAPETTAKITLKPAAGTLVITGHPIEGKIAKGKTVWADVRFFSVRVGA